jgi:sugar phosphate isomerase/epimerase
VTLLSLAHLTFVDVPPPDLVALAADAGYGAVGLRLSPARDDEAPWPMAAGSTMLRETGRRLDATGLGVLDVEVVRLTPDVDVASYAPMFEIAAELGARFAVVSGFDPDERRLTECFAALATLAAAHGVHAMLEPMAYCEVTSLAQAARIVAAAGVGGVLVDTIHVARTGGTPADVAALGPSGYLQVSDAAATSPAGLAAIADESRHARLPPGEGALPLTEVLAAFAPGTPISVEAPSAQLRAALGEAGYARRLRAATETTIEEVRWTGTTSGH